MGGKRGIKYVALVGLAALGLVLLSACSGVSAKDYDAAQQQLAAKTQELATAQQQLTAKGQELATVQQQVTAKEQEGTKLTQDLATAQQALTAKGQELAKAQQDLKAALGTARNDKEVANMKMVRPSLVANLAALQAGDVAKARNAFDNLKPDDYNTLWHGMEQYVKVRAPALYTEIEVVQQAKMKALLDDPKATQAALIGEAQVMLALWDGIFALDVNGPALSPLFNDLADIRLLRAQTITLINADLKAGDVATSKALFTQFMTKWADIEDMVKARSSSAYAEIEDNMAKVNTAFQKSAPDVAELIPLMTTLNARYGYAQSLVSNAAVNADLTKTTYTSADVQAAAVLVNIISELKASQISWAAGNFADAGTRAGNADGALLAKVTAALNAHNGADAALKKALDTYAGLAGKTGDKATVTAAFQAALDQAGYAQQVIVGQFWTSTALQDAIQKAAAGS